MAASGTDWLYAQICWAAPGPSPLFHRSTSHEGFACKFNEDSCVDLCAANLRRTAFTSPVAERFFALFASSTLSWTAARSGTRSRN